MNKVFKKSLQRASSVIKNRKQLRKLMESSEQKNGESVLEPTSEGKLKVFIAMIKQTLAGSYKPRNKTLLYVVGALLYLINPLDLVPDFIIGIGYIDDMSVLAFVGNRLQNEIERFKLTRQIEPLGVDLKRNEQFKNS